MITVFYIPGTSPQSFYTADTRKIIVNSRANVLNYAFAENNTFISGTVNLTGGYNFSSANKNFSIGAIGKTPTTLTLTANCANQAVVVSEINSKIATAGLTNDVQAFAADNGKIGIKVVSAWGTQLTLASGAQDALAVMGMTAGTYNINMASGYNFSTNSPTFSVTIGSSTPAVITLNQNQTTLADTIAYINAKLAASFITEVEAYDNNRGIGSAIGLRGKPLAAANNFTIAVGTNYDVLNIMGWLPGTYSEVAIGTAVYTTVEILRASNNTAYAMNPEKFYLEVGIGQDEIFAPKTSLEIGDNLRAVSSITNRVSISVNLETDD